MNVAHLFNALQVRRYTGSSIQSLFGNFKSDRIKFVLIEIPYRTNFEQTRKLFAFHSILRNRTWSVKFNTYRTNIRLWTWQAIY